MQRLYLFIETMPWGARLQTLVVAIILGWYAWIDIQFGIWPISLGIVLLTFLLAWLLKPVMMAHQRATFKIWGACGMAFLLTYVLAQKQQWWLTMYAHFGREFFMWLDLSCGYWFISEVRLQQMRAAEMMQAYEQQDEPVQPVQPVETRSDDDLHSNFYGEKSDSSR